MDIIVGVVGDTDVSELVCLICILYEEVSVIVVVGCNGIFIVDDGQIVDDGCWVDHVCFEVIVDIVDGLWICDVDFICVDVDGVVV